MTDSTFDGNFDYADMVGRNLGFVDEDQQKLIRGARIFVVGTGGMGGACIQSLVRTGVGAFELADFDSFEVSNFNRQVFSSIDTVGQSKAHATADSLRKINPEIEVRVHGEDWTQSLDDILLRCKIVVNGMDDIAAGIHLYRRARALGCVVIDAYTSTLPSVTVVDVRDPRPEERLRFPTVGTAWDQLTPEQINGCKLKEIEYALVNSNASNHVHFKYAAEMIQGTRKRFSFAPMVITTGNLMAFEVLRKVLGLPGGPGCRGYFFNPWTNEVEKPLAEPLALLKKAAVKLFMMKLGSRAD